MISVVVYSYAYLCLYCIDQLLIHAYNSCLWYSYAYLCL